MLLGLAMTCLQVDSGASLGILKEDRKLEKHLKMKFSGRIINLDLHARRSLYSFS